jgi:ABC-type transporter Mla MlaB component
MPSRLYEDSTEIRADSQEFAMTISVQIDSQHQQATLIANDRFTFLDQQAFTQAYTGLAKRFDHYYMDLRQIGYMDRAAMAMLIQFKDHVGAGKENPVKVLVNKGDRVEAALLFAQFDSLFTLEAA